MRASARAAMNQPAEAESLFQTALKNAKSGEITAVIRQIVSTYGREGAAAKLESWIPAIRPDDWQPRLTLGDLFLLMEQVPKAKEQFVKAFELADRDEAKAAVNRRLGTVYYREGDLQAAEKAYLQVLSAEPNDLATMNNLAYLYVDSMKQPDRALPYAQRAAGLMPTEPNVLDTYGWVLAQSGQLREAESQLLRAVQLNPAMAASRYHLGWVYEQRGLLNEAQKQYRQCFELVRQDEQDPMRELVRSALDRVERGLRGEE